MKKFSIVCVLIGVIVALPLLGIFHPGFFATDDGNWMVIRLSAFYEALRSGQFPVRFLPRLNNGYGYPVADFLYPLFLYIGSFIHLFHIPYVLTVKIIFAFSFILSAAGSFLWFRKKFSETASLVGSAVYTLFPYHLWDMTKRGSLGEVLALGILPFIFWSIEKNNIFLTGFCIGFLILAHNSLALLFLPVIIGFMLITKKYKQGLFSLILGLLISAFFWIPALYDKQFTVFDRTIVSNFSSYFLGANFFDLTGIIFLAVIFNLIAFYKKIKREILYFAIVCVFSLFFAISPSFYFWEILKLGTFVQFPFRFLSITTLCTGFLAAFIVDGYNKKYAKIFALTVFLIACLSSWQYVFAKSYQYYPDSFYSTNQATTTVQNEYMPKEVKSDKLENKNSNVEVLTGDASVNNILAKGSNISFNINGKKSVFLQINFIYFPGWYAKVDGKDVKLNMGKTGLINLPVEKGAHFIKIWFGETPIRILSDMLSILGLIVIVSMEVLKNRKLVRS